MILLVFGVDSRVLCCCSLFRSHAARTTGVRTVSISPWALFARQGIRWVRLLVTSSWGVAICLLPWVRRVVVLPLRLVVPVPLGGGAFPR